MQRRYGSYIFLIVLVIHLTGSYAGNNMIESITKPLLMIALFWYFIWSTKKVSSGLKKWILLALFFSWAGDMLLMFVVNNSVFFLAGLSSFLIAHIFYILFFHSVRVRESVTGKTFLLFPVLIYYAVLMTLLSPGLGNMKLPVRIYGVFICFMLMLAMHMPYIKDKKAGLLMITGALLFVVSDSVLAINKFYNEFNGAGIVIMLTDGIAQLLIVEGAANYIVRQDKIKIQA